MPYTPYHANWEDLPSVATPITGAALEHIEGGIDDAHVTADAALAGTATNAAAIAAHIADTSDAHDASAISILDTAGDFAATDVEGALAEIQTDIEALSAAGVAEKSVRLWSSTDKSIGAGSTVTVSFDTEIFDNGGMAAATTAATSSRITIPTGGAGRYLIGWHAVFDALASTNEMTALCRLNGTTVIARGSQQAGPSAEANPVIGSTLWDADDGDYFEFLITNISAAGRQIVSNASESPIFWAIRLA